MKVCFITDLHIDIEGVMPNEIDSRAKFINVLTHVAGKSYDLMILGGDLCNQTGNEDIYRWIKKHLDAVGIPYAIIAGNHDTSALMAQIFGMSLSVHDGELYYNIQHEGIGEIMYLDTAAGWMSDDQYIWLERKIKNHETDDVIICMHHPPLLAGSLLMEPRYFFQQSERFKALCSHFKSKRFYIFCGHYHIARTVISDNIVLFITPSTFVQIDPDSEIFWKDGDRYGYRDIIMEGSKVLRTNVVYI